MADPINILRRETHTIYPAPGKKERVVAIFYRVGSLPERVLYIPENEYDKKTEKERVKEAVFG